MQFRKRVVTSALVSFGLLVGSILAPIVPCRKSPLLPNPSYQWSFCTLNPDLVQTQGVTEYFGYSTSIANSYLLLIAITFFLSMIVLHFLTKQKD